MAKDIAFTDRPEYIQLYRGGVTLIFEPELHVYYIEEDGQRFQTPSVTAILETYAKQGLTWWASNMAVAEFIERIDIDPEAREEVVRLFEEMKDAKKDKREKLREKTSDTQVTLSMDAVKVASLMYDMRGRHDRIKREAANIGTLAHNWLEEHIKALIAGTKYSGPLPDDPRAVSCINAALEWMELHNFNPFMSERKIYSRLHGFTGTLDWLGEVTSCCNPSCCQHEGTQLELGDFKSSNAIHDENYMQTAAYLFALLEENEELVVSGRRILRLGKYDGAFEASTRNGQQFDADFMAFLGLMQAYCWKQQFEVDNEYTKIDAATRKRLVEKVEDGNAPIQKGSRPRLKKPVYEPIPIAV